MFYFAALLIVVMQGLRMLPLLSARIDMYRAGAAPPPSNAHIYFVGLEAIKTVSLSAVFDTVASPVGLMKADHLDEGDQLQKMSLLSDKYTPPADACNTYTVTYKMLMEYEKDMHVHIHLENNVLFAKAVTLEALLRNKL